MKFNQFKSWPHLLPFKLGIVALLLFSLIWVSGCSFNLSSETLPTLIPTEQIPTVIAQTAQARISQITPPPTNTPSPSLTPTVEQIASIQQSPTSTLILGSAGASRTPDPDASPSAESQKPANQAFAVGEIPYGVIQFIRPGPLSRVVSPIDLQVYLRPGADGRARVELYGEDNRLMYRKLFAYSGTVMVNLFTEIDFEIEGVAEAARLVVSVDDDSGRTLALASEELILLSIGDEDINPPGDLLESILIQQPGVRQLVQGGEVLVTGLARTGNDHPLLVELIDGEGRVVGQRLAGISDGARDMHRLYAAEVLYQVNSPTWVRLTVREMHSRFGTPIQVSSIEVLLGE